MTSSDIFTAQNITILYHTTWHLIPEDITVSPACSPINNQLKLNLLHSMKLEKYNTHTKLKIKHLYTFRALLQ